MSHIESVCLAGQSVVGHASDRICRYFFAGSGGVMVGDPGDQRKGTRTTSCALLARMWWEVRRIVKVRNSSSC